MDDTRLVVQIAIGLVFLASTSGKLLDPTAFARGVTDYRILPASLAFTVGLLLIPLEAFLTVSHLGGWLLNFGVPIALAVLACFATAVAVNLKRGLVLPCYCFGGQGETISGRTLARLLLLCAGELVVLTGQGLSGTGKLTYPGRVASFAELSWVFFWATLLLVAGMWLLRMTDIVALLRHCDTCGRTRHTDGGTS